MVRREVGRPPRVCENTPPPLLPHSLQLLLATTTTINPTPPGGTQVTITMQQRQLRRMRRQQRRRRQRLQPPLDGTEPAVAVTEATTKKDVAVPAVALIQDSLPTLSTTTILRHFIASISDIHQGGLKQRLRRKRTNNTATENNHEIIPKLD